MRVTNLISLTHSLVLAVELWCIVKNESTTDVDKPHSLPHFVLASRSSERL